MNNQVLSGLLIVSLIAATVGELQCDLPLVAGPCRAKFVRWGSKGGRCVTFTYGGCEANTNNFITKEDCERACPPTSSEAPVDTCELPLETGPCRANFPRWGMRNGDCVEFTYGGCEGNQNNFRSAEECERACPSNSSELYTAVVKEAPVDTCQLPLVTGLCRGLFPSWGSRDGNCVSFTYGGCGGNENRFSTKEECERACPPTVTTTTYTPVNTCQQPIVTGPCRAAFRSWGSRGGECVEFTYGGCEGNDNRFRTKDECERACPPTLPSTTLAPVDPCQQPLEAGECRAYILSWGRTNFECIQFVFGGCGGNDNRFETKAECERNCPPAATTTEQTPVDTCQLPLVAGRCRGYFLSWGSRDGECVEFVYGGCEGNDNRFETKAECERNCPPATTTTVQTHVDTCQLPLLTGSCRGYFLSWGSRDGQCVDFVYGGCEGNDNRFSTKAECERACPPPVTTTVQTPVDICRLPLVAGRCRGNFPSWGSRDGECVEFVYGGCEGNENRFSTKENCEKTCPPTVTTTVETPVDTCQLPLLTGRCRGYFPSWGSRDGQCVEFVYGGCEGNDNRFSTKAECEKTCPPTVTTTVQTPVDTCQLPLLTGSCRGYFPSWGSRDGECVEFVYGGCGGNENRFTTKAECERACPPPITTTVQTPVDICRLPLVAGRCLAYFPSWGSMDGECVEFVYGGCEGNGNRFPSKEDCDAACHQAKPANILAVDDFSVTPVDRCQLPLETGPCRASITRWGSRNGTCVPFIYGGCEANQNNFDTRENCERTCPPPVTTTVQTTVDTCQLPLLTGRCRGYFPSWGSKDGECVEFVYGGCEGNKNRFPTKAECERTCPPPVTTTVQTPVDICGLPLVAGRCMAYFPSWGSRDGECVEFVYGGCEGNDNRFSTKAECESTCPPPITTTVQTPVGTCQLPLLTGYCRGYFLSWGSKDGECVEFVYGGCGGNDNRFESKEECERACIVTPPTTPADTCQMPLVTGPCRGNFRRWGSSNGQCTEFTYGGCGGNQNRFETREECETACPAHKVCSLPVESGPCRSYMPRWADVGDKCKEFIYGGCAGNANRFLSKEDCDAVCHPAKPANILAVDDFSVAPVDRCQLPLKTGPCRASITRWGSQNGTCVSFTYGGCEANQNNFDTQADCERQCPVKPPTVIPVDVCDMPLVTGSCRGNFRRWGSKGGECVEFTYGGCGGNDNRYRTKEQCELSCPPYKVCSLPVDAGNCYAYMPRWANVGETCEEFVFGGCGGNGNRFSSKENCEAVCHRTDSQLNVMPSPHNGSQPIHILPAVDPIGIPVNTPVDRCQLPLVTGPCRASFTRWGSQNGTCVPFLYGGCEANQNNFESQEACMNQCMPQPTPISKPKRCQLSDDVSDNCVAGSNRWMYDISNDSCYVTQLSRCGRKGILRGFRTLRSCEKYCKN